mmetsp:Transcript_34430/g.87016  ORF Transcript_34430/g.87016 Transcript_34430/m.87016 type:complete len:211 (-) Transcript_34430:735-1367(-)
MKPTARQLLLSGLFVLEVPLHHNVAPKHNLPYRLAIRRNFLHRLGVQNLQILQHMIVDPLPHPQPRLLSGLKLVPHWIPRTHNGRTVCLGQAVYVKDVETLGLQSFQRSDRRGSRCCHDTNLVVEFTRFFLLCVCNHVENNGGTAQMGGPTVRNRVINCLAADMSDANTAPPNSSHRPRKAPSVAMKHRQRPEITGVVLHVPPNDVSQCV